MDKKIRLQKYLAQCGVASRRKAEEFILSGRVSIDGRINTKLGVSVNPAAQKIAVDGKPVSPETQKIYVLLNKPKGYVTTLSDPQGRPVVTDLIKEVDERVFPVGRLDINTEGALILTNDGEFSQQVQHPRNEIHKTYEAHVSGFPTRKSLEKLESGIEIDGILTAPATASITKRFSTSSLITITIHEGKKRQVRKMFAAIGHPVINLRRIAYGGLFLAKLGKGSYRILTPKDLQKIFKDFPLHSKK